MASATQWLFTYGSLKYERHGYQAEARGELRRHPDGFAVARFDRAGRINGRLEQVTDADLVTLDARESGYRRIRVQVSGAPIAWAYEWAGADFDRFAILSDGIWRENS